MRRHRGGYLSMEDLLTNLSADQETDREKSRDISVLKRCQLACTSHRQLILENTGSTGSSQGKTEGKKHRADPSPTPQGDNPRAPH